MKRLPTAAVLVSLLAVTAVAQVDRSRTTKTPAGDPAGVQRASCVLQIDTDGNRGYRTFDAQTLNALLTSTALTDPAAKKAFDLGPADWPKAAQIEVAQAGANAVRLAVTVLPEAKLPPAAAQRFLDALAARAQAAVDQVGESGNKAAADRIAKLEAKVADAQKKFDAATAALAAARPSAFANYDNDPRYLARNAAVELSSLTVNLHGQQASLAALDAEMARLNPAATQPTVDASADAPASVFTGRPPSMPPTAGLSVYDRFAVERITLRCNIAETQARAEMLKARVAESAPTTQSAAVDNSSLQMEQSNARNALQIAQSQLEQARNDRQSTGIVRLLLLDGRKAGE